MSDNHNHDKAAIEALDAILATGRPGSDEMLNSLAGTMPQARPEFQQSLEDQLIAQLSDPTAHRSTAPMQADYSPRNRFAPSKQGAPLRFSLTLAAAFGALILAALIFLSMSRSPGPDSDPDMMAAAQIAETATPIQSTESISPTDTGLVDAQLQIAEATASALSEEFEQQTAFVGCQFFTTTADTVIYANPATNTGIVETLPAGTRLEVSGALETRETTDLNAFWLQVVLENESEISSGWTLPYNLAPSEACGEFTETVQFYRGRLSIEATIVHQNNGNLPLVLDVTATPLHAAETMPFTPTPRPSVTHTATWTITPSATHTPTPFVEPRLTNMPASAVPLVVTVEQLPDERYQITLPVSAPVESDDIRPGDTVDVLAWLNYGEAGQIWASVAQNLLLEDMNAMTESPTSSFATLYATLITSDADVVTTIENLARAGTMLTLVHSR